jgi:toxin ParE1/3/4
VAQVSWTDAALADVERIYDHIAEVNPAAAAALTDALLKAGNSLNRFPNRGRPASHGSRELVVVAPLCHPL